jgi:hypothetical protein
MKYVHVVIIMDCIHPSKTIVKVFQELTHAEMYAIENNGQLYTCRVGTSFTSSTIF